MRGRVCGLVIVFDAMMRKVLGGCHIFATVRMSDRATAAWSFLDPPVSIAPLWT